MVLFCLFLVSEIHLGCVHIIFVRFRLLSATVSEIAAHSVDHVFLLSFDYL